MITEQQKQHFLKYKRLLKDCNCNKDNCKHQENLIKWVNNHLKKELKLKIWNLQTELKNKSYEYN